MAPATPTGLHVDETTANSITWHWDAVEGALGYVVQANMDGEWDETDTVLFDGVPFTTETSYTATDLEPETMVYVRVAAAAGSPAMPLVSEFSEGVSGTSAMPPPVPTPFMVEFMIPDGKYPMVPDDDVKPTTAMAMVNPNMGVSVNRPAIIMATFVPNANPIGLLPGENMPFKYVEWNAPQALVISMGVTFAIHAVEIGANQVPIPIGDATLVTCGPFNCAMGTEAPEFSVADSPICDGWEPDLELQVGLVDNDVLPTDGDDDAARAADGITEDDGIDVGWLTTSSTAMTVTHIFSGVPDGTNYEVSGPDAGKGTDKKMAMNKRDTGTADFNENESYNPGILVEQIGGSTDGDPASSIVGTGYTVFGDATGELVSPCVPVDGDSTFTYADTIGANHRPDTCFRVTADGDSNYFDGYTVEVQPTDASVSWGKVAWPDEPFADLECEAVTFSAMDQVDVCEMFEAEVDQALDGGWGGRFGTVKFGLSERVAGASAAKIDHWTVAASPGTPDRFKTLWFDDNLNGKIKKDPTTPGATSNRPDPDGAGTDAAKGDANAMHDLYDDNGDPANIEVIWQYIHDADADPVYGDFGKVDLRGADRDGDVAGNDEMDPDGKADNYTLDARGCTDLDGEGCDSVWSNDYEVLFADGVFGCTTTRMVTISCEWDAQGELGKYTRKDHDGQSAEGDVTADGFLGIDLVADGATGARVAGHVGAFAKCVAN